MTGQEGLTPSSLRVPGRGVCMFHVGRSGSTVLASLLVKDGRFDWHGEIVMRRVIRPFDRRCRRLGELPEAPDAEAEAALTRKRGDELAVGWDEIYGSMLEQGSQRAGQILGFEVKFFHLALTRMPLAAFLAASEKVGFDRFIVLERRNLLRKVVSSLILRDYRIHTTTDPSGLPPRRVYLDVKREIIDRAPHALLDYLGELEAHFQELRPLLHDRPHLWLRYEDDVEADPVAGYRRVCEFLSLPPRDVSPDLQRVNPEPLCELIENFDEVGAFLRGSRFEWMLND